MYILGATFYLWATFESYFVSLLCNFNKHHLDFKTTSVSKSMQQYIVAYFQEPLVAS